MKPDWKDAPKWAKWLAQDECGEWGWYEVQPTAKYDHFTAVGGEHDRAVISQRNADWKSTLGKRPAEIGDSCE